MTIFDVLNAPIRGVQALFGHQKNRAFPSNPAYPECLSVESPIILPYSEKEKVGISPAFQYDSIHDLFEVPK